MKLDEAIAVLSAPAPRTAAEIIDELVSVVIPDDATPGMLWHRQHELAELARTLRPLSPAREIAETLRKRLEARRGWMAAREFLR